MASHKSDVPLVLQVYELFAKVDQCLWLVEHFEPNCLFWRESFSCTGRKVLFVQWKSDQQEKRWYFLKCHCVREILVACGAACEKVRLSRQRKFMERCVFIFDPIDFTSVYETSRLGPTTGSCKTSCCIMEVYWVSKILWKTRTLFNDPNISHPVKCNVVWAPNRSVSCCGVSNGLTTEWFSTLVMVFGVMDLDNPRIVTDLMFIFLNFDTVSVANRVSLCLGQKLLFIVRKSAFCRALPQTCWMLLESSETLNSELTTVNASWKVSKRMGVRLWIRIHSKTGPPDSYKKSSTCGFVCFSFLSFLTQVDGFMSLLTRKSVFRNLRNYLHF